MISSGESSISVDDIRKITDDYQLLAHYLGIHQIPCIINSPLRQDKNPSFGFYSPKGCRIYYHDFSTGERGGVFTLLQKLWNLSFKETLKKIYKDFKTNNYSHNIYKNVHNENKKRLKPNTQLECRVRNWQDHDIKYWESYGVPLKWLKYANVYPISHKIVIKDGQRYVFGADKYAYAFAEFKDGKTTLKIYQPYNKKGFKWSNKHDSSVISLWTKVPERGDKICICSSLKDALCLWANVNIPSIAIQGEGYNISKTAIKELKRRFTKQYILLDNDKTGIKDAESLAKLTGFTNITLPKINNAKDISDLYLSLKNKEQFKTILLNLFN